MGVEIYELTESRIIKNGGKVAMPKNALSEWRGRDLFDTEWKWTGIHNRCEAK